jgi:hypothetical protein
MTDNRVAALAMKRDFAGLHQLKPLQARVTVLADNDVVVHSDAERAGDRDDRLGHLDIRLRRRRIARWMVVQEPTSLTYRVE